MSPASYRTAPPRVVNPTLPGPLGLLQIEGSTPVSGIGSGVWVVESRPRTFCLRGRAGEAGSSMLGARGRETRGALGAALLVVAGLRTQRWGLRRWGRGAAAAEQASARLRESLDAERRRADALAAELAQARAQ